MKKMYCKGVILIALLLAAVLTACDNPSGSNGSGTPPTDTGAPKVSGESVLDTNGSSPSTRTGKVAFRDYFLKEIGKIENGKLTFDLTGFQPTNLENIGEYLNSDESAITYSGQLTISNPNAKYVWCYLYFIENDSDYYDLYLEGNSTTTVNGDDKTRTYDREEYIYVDQDVTISGTRSAADGYYANTRTFNNVTLKKGWNKLYNHRIQISDNVEPYSSTNTYSTTPVNGLKWVLSSH